jgi:hypothetical protein
MQQSKKNYIYRLCACTGRTGKRPAGHGAVGVRAPPHRRGDLDVGHSGRQVERVGELALSFIVYGKVGQTMPAPPRPLPSGTTPFPSSSQRDGEWSRRRIAGREVEQAADRGLEANGQHGGDLFGSWGSGSVVGTSERFF